MINQKYYMIKERLKYNLRIIKNPVFKVLRKSFAKDGRSYKLYVKSSVLWKCRFNKTNPNYFFLKNIKRIKMRRYKNYMMFPFWKTKDHIIFDNNIRKIRPFDTYTNRGLLNKSKVFHKR